MGKVIHGSLHEVIYESANLLRPIKLASGVLVFFAFWDLHFSTSFIAQVIQKKKKINLVKDCRMSRSLPDDKNFYKEYMEDIGRGLTF